MLGQSMEFCKQLKRKNIVVNYVVNFHNFF